jgi:hypothetical protein
MSVLEGVGTSQRVGSRITETPTRTSPPTSEPPKPRSEAPHPIKCSWHRNHCAEGGEHRGSSYLAACTTPQFLCTCVHTRAHTHTHTETVSCNKRCLLIQYLLPWPVPLYPVFFLLYYFCKCWCGPLKWSLHPLRAGSLKIQMIP